MLSNHIPFCYPKTDWDDNCISYSFSWFSMKTMRKNIMNMNVIRPLFVIQNDLYKRHIHCVCLTLGIETACGVRGCNKSLLFSYLCNVYTPVFNCTDKWNEINHWMWVITRHDLPLFGTIDNISDLNFSFWMIKVFHNSTSIY